jgi:Histidine kinase-, DNA gyrase B-, and HSP90-like ATPase
MRCRILGYHRDVTDVLHLCVRCDDLAPAAVWEKMRGLHNLGSALHDAMLVASELVTTAVRHSLCAEDDFLDVRITRDGRLLISVRDPGASGSSAQIADRPIELGGLGLKVVEQVAATWGTERRNDGYGVWAELSLAG